MERESFEDKDVAEILNKHFISIKVDREERTDIDSIYMTFCQAYTGSGGWPLTVIITPDKKPFFAGTYFPKESKYGRMGIIDLLNSIQEVWVKDRQRIDQTSEDMIKEILRHTEIDSSGEIEKDLYIKVVDILKEYFEPKYGGFSKAPKFPTPHHMYFLLEYYKISKDKETLQMVEKTLKSMYAGGIFDHVGFGFSRYSTDNRWLVPHFEKMLYDNSLLVIIYTEAYEITKNNLYKEIAEKIYTYMLRTMTSEEGGFYSAEDADSEGVEGKFYLWDLEEIKSILGEKRAEVYSKIYDITEHGNFEGRNIPNLIGIDLIEVEQEKELKNQLEDIRKELFKYREERVHPFKDDKILTAWNGFAVVAFARGGKILKNSEYIDTAKKAADFIISRLIRDDGRLLSRYREGESAYLGVLEDYSFFIWGLIELYEATNLKKYLDEALKLNKEMLKLFLDKNKGGLYLYGLDSEKLIIRPKELYDGAIPSGNSVAAFNMVRLYDITGDVNIKEEAKRQIKAFGKSVSNNPIGYTFFITAAMHNSILDKK